MIKLEFASHVERHSCPFQGEMDGVIMQTHARHMVDRADPILRSRDLDLPHMFSFVDQVNITSWFQEEHSKHSELTWVLFAAVAVFKVATVVAI